MPQNPKYPIVEFYDIVEQVAKEMGIPKYTANQIFRELLDLIKELIAEGHTISIPTFLKLKATPVKGHPAYDINKKQMLMSQKHYKVTPQVSELFILDFYAHNNVYYSTKMKRIAEHLGYDTLDWTFYNPNNEQFYIPNENNE